VIRALQTIKEGICDPALKVLQSTTTFPSEVFLSILLNNLSAAENWTLVLDDYHLISNEVLHQGLAFLVDHLPEGMHIVVASRVVPPLPLARLSARDRLIEIGKQDLSFTAPEIGQFFERAREIVLSPVDIEVLQTKTEGWAAGLQLVALSMRTQPQASAYVAELTGSHRRIADFLMAEVLRQQPSYVQEFLLKTSILDRLCAPLCDALLGSEWGGSQAMLDGLEHKNLFLVALDDERRWYRYHHLFADFLRDALARTYPDLLAELYGRASRWYEGEGLIKDAVQSSLFAKDIEHVARLIEMSYERMIRHSETVTLLKWIEAVPEDLVRRRPLLCLARAWSLEATPDRFREAEGWCQAAERALQANDPGSWDEKRRNTLLGKLAHLRSAVAIIQNDHGRALQFSLEAARLLPTDAQHWQDELQVQIGIAYFLAGNYPVARSMLTEAIQRHDPIHNVLIGCWARYYLAGVEIAEGRLRTATESLRGALDFARLSDHSYMTAAMGPLIALSQILYEWSQLDAALEHLNLGIRLCSGYWRRDITFEGHLTLARIRQAQGDAQNALTAIQRAEALFDLKQMAHLLAHTAATHLRIWLDAGYLQPLQEMMASMPKTPASDGEGSVVQQDQALVVARLLVAQGEFRMARRWLDPLVQSSEQRGFNRRLIETLVLRAVALWGERDTQQASLALERALELAEPEGFVRVFVDEGAPIQAMLELTAARGGLPNYCARLLAEFKDTPTAATKSLALVEPLTERELQILSLLALGLSTAEIAGKLVITVGTAKNHLHHIYAKLQVKNRLQAVQRAQEAGLP